MCPLQPNGHKERSFLWMQTLQCGTMYCIMLWNLSHTQKHCWSWTSWQFWRFWIGSLRPWKLKMLILWTLRLNGNILKLFFRYGSFPKTFFKLVLFRFHRGISIPVFSVFLENFCFFESWFFKNIEFSINFCLWIQFLYTWGKHYAKGILKLMIYNHFFYLLDILYLKCWNFNFCIFIYLFSRSVYIVRVVFFVHISHSFERQDSELFKKSWFKSIALLNQILWYFF